MDATTKLIEDLTDVALGRKSERPVLTAAPDRSATERHLHAAATNAQVDTMPEPPGRGRATKRIILKSGRFVFNRQRAVNQALIGVVHELLAELDTLNTTVAQEQRRAAAATAAAEADIVQSADAQHRRLDALQQRVDAGVASTAALDELVRRQATRLDAIAANLDGLGTGVLAVESIATSLDELRSEVTNSAGQVAKRVDDVLADLVLERHRREVLERELRALRIEMSGRSVSDAATPSERAPLPSGLDTSGLSEVYDRFERYFRPVSSELDARFTDYVSDLEHLQGGQRPVLDIGTGRGEFLRVLRDAGIPAIGVDTNAEAVAAAVGRDLEVLQVDALTYLSTLEKESLGGVTAFHVVEHLEPTELIDLIDAIVRVLMPGGLVIFETPNPTNLAVGAAAFYHDPTHRRPLTPDYLSFLLRDRGLVDVETRFLHPLPEFELPLDLPSEPGQAGLKALLEDVRWALKGPQDFAVVGRGPVGS